MNAKGAPFDELNLAQARLDGTNLSGVDVSGAILAGTWLHNTNVSDSNVSGADLRAAYLEHTSFARSDLRNVNCEGCNLIQVYFSSADLRGANFVSAGVRSSEFLGADLRGADLTGVREYDGANFRFANIARVRADARFIAFATRQGAILIADDQAWSQYEAKIQRRSDDTSPRGAPIDLKQCPLLADSGPLPYMWTT